jgi:hypothetical protein
MCHNPVLCLDAGVGDCSLSLGCSRDEVVIEVDTLAGSGASRVGAASPVRIRVCGDRLDRANTNVKDEGEGALQVPKNPLEQH